MGVHEFQGRLWATGNIGVLTLSDSEGNPLTTNGRQHIAIIEPRFKLNPWQMLREVLLDDEYGSYIKELDEDSGDFLYKVFYDRPLLRLPKIQASDCNLLYAISFIDACYQLCKKGLKRSVVHCSENYVAKIKGRIDAKSNIRQNTAKGRNDRFCCRYTTLEIDNIENRILKAALQQCKKIIGRDFANMQEMQNRLHFCETALRNVKDTDIALSDFSKASATGLYSYYQSALMQAKCVFQRKYRAIRKDDPITTNGYVFTTQYLINMERLFEFYVRGLVKKQLVSVSGKYALAPYSKKWYLQKDAEENGECVTNAHLVKYCIPDIVVVDNDSEDAVLVLDAKYKIHDRASRNDSHQLLTYAAVTGAAICGFVLPDKRTQLKEFMPFGVYSVTLNAPYSLHEIHYCELLVGDDSNMNAVNELLSAATLDAE